MINANIELFRFYDFPLLVVHDKESLDDETDTYPLKVVDQSGLIVFEIQTSDWREREIQNVEEIVRVLNSVIEPQGSSGGPTHD